MKFVILISAVALSGCAGKLEYARPTSQAASTSNSKIIEKPRDAVWNSGVPELGKRFFVINNLDKSSGLINVSYNGDPEKYIDCGRINSYVKNAHGERTYDFPGAKAQQHFEVMNPGVGLFAVDRRMALDGRVNLVFEEIDSNKTRVTANTRYVVQRTQVIRNVGNGIPQTFTESITFNSGSGASYPASADGRFSECVAKGTLEVEILSAIN